MLSDEQAQQRLKEMKSADWRVQAKRRTGRLPKLDGEAVRRLADLQPDKQGHDTTDWAKRLREQEKRRRQAAAHLDALSSQRRTASFAAVFPRLAEHLERAWQSHKASPYQARFSFRAPSEDAITGPARAGWLEDLTNHLSGYDPDAVWVAEWAPYITRYYGGDVLGRLLAAAIDGGGEEGNRVLQTLIDSANGDHEIGAMGRHVTTALMSCSRPEAWDYVEKLLLAAQRQEGLRQAILEAIDLAHPDAYRRMLRLILEHNLVRFASVVRAADVWFALRWDSASAKVIKTAIERALRYLDDAEARALALKGTDPEEAFMALWAIAFEDATRAVPAAARLLEHDKVDMRFTGGWLLMLLGLNRAHDALRRSLDDEDLRLVNLGLSSSATLIAADELKEPMFAKLVEIVGRLPAKVTKLKPLLWPWLEFTIERSEAADLLPLVATEEDWPRVIDHVSAMSPNGRAAVIATLKKRKTPPVGARELLLKLTGDRSGGVRDEAVKLLGRQEPTPAEAEHLEELLTRKSGDLRRGILRLLAKQTDAEALRSAERLIAAKSKPQRLAGLELVRTLHTTKRAVKKCTSLINAYCGDHAPLSDDEQNLVDPVIGIVRTKPKLDDVFGLLDASKLTRPAPLAKPKATLFTKAAGAYLSALDDVVHVHRETPVTVETWEGEKQELLGNASSLWRYHEGEQREVSAGFPLKEVWLDWYEKRPKQFRDRDGFDAARASVITSFFDWRGALHDASGMTAKVISGSGEAKLRYPRQVRDIVEFLARRHRPSGLIDYWLAASETALSLIPSKFVVRWLRTHNHAYRAWLGRATADFLQKPSRWSDEQIRRLIHIHLWLDQPVDRKGREMLAKEKLKQQEKLDEAEAQKARAAGQYARHLRGRYSIREPIDVRLMGHALRLKCWNEHDAIARIVGVGTDDHPRHVRNSAELMGTLTTRKPHRAIQDYPPLADIVDSVRTRLLEVEVARGEEATEATNLASRLQTVPGTDWLVRVLVALGKLPFLRSYSYYTGEGKDKKSIFSELIRASLPDTEDSVTDFAAKVKAAGIAEKRLIELAVFAPQWAAYVEHTLGWPGFEDGVWWIHAHTKDDQWSVPKEAREAWAAEVSERTPLDSRDLVDGAVDVAWFTRTYETLKKKRWDQLYAAAKNASAGGGHKRAQLFADAMLGRVTKTELTQRIKEKRHKDAVRALGLLPLARGKGRDGDLLRRYELLQEFLRTSKQFGSMRQTSEKRAVEIGQANLARTAGYPGPLRLQWAMEAKAVQDLADGAVSVTVGPTTVSLSVTDTGEPVIGVEKDGKALKSIPAAAKKDRNVKGLRDRKTALKRQASRMRKTLEQMMCDGEGFLGEELAGLAAHPLMRPMLERLVFIGEGIIGYPREGGRLLEDYSGKREPVKKSENLRLAHPYDLLDRGDWSDWQRDCFAGERVQPFKQLFRELYVLTEAERTEATGSKRYAGQQANPRQAIALLGGRGWVVLPEEGVRKTYHDHKLSVWIEFQEHFYTPAEVDGLTIENVRFSRPGEWQPIPLTEVPPLIFSEVMRDVDLVVSVAHRGGVDPEASASTIEMRSDLLRETLAVLGIENVRIEDHHALIDGEHAKYTLHLGSAVTHVMPGGSLFIVAVHSQHRGRLFLPFADDDPKTAEVMSKTLLLARDKQIKDPNILDQIRRLT
ncbi:MAG: DUF5724 domain-containing protein [Planctomycetota bacterium]